MAGPTCSVLLPSEPDEQTTERINRALDLASWPDDRRNGLLVYEVRAVDEGPEQYEPDELAQIDSGFGWTPKMQIVCISMIGADQGQHAKLADGAYGSGTNKHMRRPCENSAKKPA